MDKTKLKELLKILLEANIEVLKTMDTNNVKDRASTYIIKSIIDEQFDIIFKAIGMNDDPESRKTQVEKVIKDLELDALDAKTEELMEVLDGSVSKIKENEFFNGLKKGEVAEA